MRAARSFGVRDGHDIVFVSHTGEICPAGFLPLVAGKVRTDRLADVYGNARASDPLCTHEPDAVSRTTSRTGAVQCVIEYTT